MALSIAEQHRHGLQSNSCSINAVIRKIFITLFTANEVGFLFIAILMFFMEIGIVYFVIQRVPYTEIDWRTYMQHVDVYMKGERNYSHISGDTGPIVYPAAHLYIYRILYSFTEKGQNIRRAQYFFASMYLVNLVLVFRLFYYSKRIPPFVLCLICLSSYRIHSIFILRLFNDPIAMTLFFTAVNLFISRHWFSGCIFYSTAVGVKMNIFLFAPALFFILLLSNGIIESFWLLLICAFVQCLISIEFLTFDIWAYMTRAFEFGRVFLFKWTVNWRFMNPALFVDPKFHLFLLFCHITLLCLMIAKLWFREYGGLRNLLKRLHYGVKIRFDTHDILFVLFTSNLAGIAFARSLHYQFYCWYYYTIPYLLFSPLYTHEDAHYEKQIELGFRTLKIPLIKEISIRLLIMLGIEFCWNTYPSTVFSSLLLNILHFTIIYLVFKDSRRQSSEQIIKELINKQ